MTAIARLYRVILPVADIDRAAKFYGEILQTPGERVSEGRHYFDCGGTILACYDPAADGDDLAGGWRFHELQYLYLSVEDLEAMLARFLKAGGTMLGDGIKRMPWGEESFYCKDPFGGLLCFVRQGTEFTGKRPDARSS